MVLDPSSSSYTSDKRVTGPFRGGTISRSVRSERL